MDPPHGAPVDNPMDNPMDNPSDPNKATVNAGFDGESERYKVDLKATIVKDHALVGLALLGPKNHLSL